MVRKMLLINNIPDRYKIHYNIIKKLIMKHGMKIFYKKIIKYLKTSFFSVFKYFFYDLTAEKADEISKSSMLYKNYDEKNQIDFSLIFSFPFQVNNIILLSLFQ